MKLFSLIIFLNFLGNIFGVLYFGNESKGQIKGNPLIENKVSLHIAHLPLREALFSLEKASHLRFIFQEASLRFSNLIEADFKQQNVGDILNTLLEGTDLQYKAINNSEIAIIPLTNSKDIIIKGKVVDKKTKQPLPGVTVILKGTQTGVSTDAGGNFSISVPNINSVLEFSYIGYAREEIRIGNKTNFTINLIENAKQLGEVVVSAKRRTNNETAMLTERKNSAVVSDGISAKNISKTASITTAQALKRVSGVTITDDKYVAVRGLGDRSVIAELNGARLSSSDPDRSSVPLDLVPAALLDNITVYKTITPDKPADASAGIIELKTKSVPDSLVLNFSVESGTNSSIGFGGTYNAFIDSRPGFLGENVQKHDLSPAFLNLANQYPGGLQQIQELFINSRNSTSLNSQTLQINSIMHSFDPVLTTHLEKTNPNQIYAINFGNSFKIFGGHQLGIVLGLNYYDRTEDIYNGTLTNYTLFSGVLTGNPNIFNPLVIQPFTTPNDLYLSKYLSYNEHTVKENINYGWLAALTYRFNARNQISFQYLGSRGAEVQGSSLDGSFQNTRLPDYQQVFDQVFSLIQSYRTFNNFNLQGEHRILKSPFSPQISWNASLSKSSQDEPDFRYVELAHLHTQILQGMGGAALGSDTYALASGTVHITPGDSILIDPNGRRFRTLNETNKNVKADLTLPLPITFQNKNSRIELKLGVNYLQRDRTFIETVLTTPGSNFNPASGSILKAVQGNLDALVGYNYIGLQGQSNYDSPGAPRIGGFIYQTLKSPNNYSGFYETRAFYGMFDARINSRLRLVGGVRFENTQIGANVDTIHVMFNQISFQSNSFQPNTSLALGYKPFYSANLVYSPFKSMNFRAAYSTSLARPELREITNIFEFDPFQFALVGGNANLRDQLTRSLDFRWEYFGNPGEVYSVSLFGKLIDNQLTKVYSFYSSGSFSSTPEYPVVKFTNDPEQGKVYGLELEARKNLENWIPPLKYFFFNTNLLLAQSLIQKNAARIMASRINDRTSPNTSPIFEQAPYSLNASLDYDNTKSGTDATLSFNIVGERLVQVQLNGTPDLFDRPVPILDFVFSQHFKKRFLFKGFAKNILNPIYKTVYTNANQNGYYNNREYIHHSYKRGIEFSFGISYDLF